MRRKALREGSYEYTFILICERLASASRKFFSALPEKFSLNALTAWLYGIKK
jgi:hypothetical protein